MSDTEPRPGAGNRAIDFLRPSQQGREALKTRAAVIAFRCSLRIAALSVLDHLDGHALDEIKETVEGELEHAFKMGGEPPPEE